MVLIHLDAEAVPFENEYMGSISSQSVRPLCLGHLAVQLDMQEMGVAMSYG